MCQGLRECMVLSYRRRIPCSRHRVEQRKVHPRPKPNAHDGRYKPPPECCDTMLVYNLNNFQGTTVIPMASRFSCTPTQTLKF